MSTNKYKYERAKNEALKLVKGVHEQSWDSSLGPLSMIYM